MKSTLLNMVLVLLGITLVASAALGVVYSVTKGPIEDAKKAKTTNALAQVMPEFDNDPASDTATYVIDEMPLKVYTGRKAEAVSGYAVETMTKNGFSGVIKMMIGFTPAGDIENIVVLQHNETPGLGSKMTEPGNPLIVSFQGKNPKDLKMSVRKDGGDIDVITASTISSRAYVDAVNRGFKAFEAAAFGMEPEEDKAVDNRFSALFGKYDNDPESEIAVAGIDGNDLKIFKVSENGRMKGYAVESSAKGYKGQLSLLVGFTPESVISGIVVMENHGTPGYGAVVNEPDNVMLKSFAGKNASKLKFDFKADGGDVDAISGSTVTSRAYLNAVKNAYLAYRAQTLNNSGK